MRRPGAAQAPRLETVGPASQATPMVDTIDSASSPPAPAAQIHRPASQPISRERLGEIRTTDILSELRRRGERALILLGARDRLVDEIDRLNGQMEALGISPQPLARHDQAVQQLLPRPLDRTPLMPTVTASCGASLVPTSSTSTAKASPNGRRRTAQVPANLLLDAAELVPAYRTGRGTAFAGSAEALKDTTTLAGARGKVQLIFTSPPFPLNRKKRYGNLQGEEYVKWLAGFAPVFRDLLRPDGSIVIELGNAWEPGSPVMSTLALEALIAFMTAGNLYLCQQFVCHNPTRLPSPTQWVNVDRIRVKDAYTHVWWMAPTPRPACDNRRVLVEYSEAMKSLLRRQKYNAGRRPSDHHIGATSFLTNNGGAIPSNVLTYPNTQSINDAYLDYCQRRKLPRHPARMNGRLAEFFIRFLTKPRNLVLDPFAGSNTTGSVAEKLRRRWFSIEPNMDYIRGSMGRFEERDLLH